MSQDHLTSVGLATAALYDIIGRGQAMQAAIIRGAAQQEIVTMRAEVHDVIDAYLDHTAAAARAVQVLSKPPS